ncbi:hypothetical protein N478_06125 [Pseudoalteromonas luteoviolacea S4060-1]|uniref:Uncharacterized protein n=1 Tax=Pseudoalteromonas luteoviolacea S4060-1 TaxID=1365257 RepID=A0A162C3P7_9GAMM|nr:hypothetical protein N478_06125 [Pseudoalteromonas luteoviolacea S4060-1]
MRITAWVATNATIATRNIQGGFMGDFKWLYVIELKKPSYCWAFYYFMAC